MDATPQAPASVRRARQDDYDAVTRLLEQVDEMHRAALPWLFRAPAGPARPAAEFEASLTAADRAIWVAVDASDRALGVAIGLMRSTTEHPLIRPARYGLLDVLVVDVPARGRGLGRALALAFEQWAIAEAAEWLEVKVYAFNDAARRAYAAQGYAPLALQLRKPLGGG